MRIRYRAQALSDIDEIQRFLQERSPDGARKVVRAIYAGVQLIAEHPLATLATDDPGYG